jgi:hypothetical protein
MQACGMTAGQLVRYARPRAARRVSGEDVARIARPVTAASLMAVMVLGSLALWTAIPVAGLWIASQLTDSGTHIGTVPLIVVAGGVPVAMAFGAKMLARVERRYMHLRGTDPQPPVAPAWGRSLGDSSSVRASVLDRIMVASVMVAATATAVWFFAFAGPSIPR